MFARPLGPEPEKTLANFVHDYGCEVKKAFRHGDQPTPNISTT